ncbi:hypothetical protein [Neptunomonas antarctica]|uniref:Uncharacterized protein n=1 Tax=Neptunomonas antarctica TaxID=619304 RepID=A0A1N7NHZ0_9GAMM|nr:hypothetical protein [Neptunomonas antarctica]SIS97932.1 hypothetical protein SAMN05421760_109150 [Neptunomonas antarctica]
MLEWKKESNYVIHESGFTIIVEEGSFYEPSSIQIKQSEAVGAIEQAKLLREGMEFVRSKTRQTLIPGRAPLDNNRPIITVKKTRKTRTPDPVEEN